MSASAVVVRSWPVGHYTCTLSVPANVKGVAAIEWSPTTPRALNEAELAAYTAGRNLAVAQIADELGVAALVVEL